MSLLRRWFSVRGDVGRRFYVLSGLGLMPLKYSVDALLTYIASHTVLSPLVYLNPLFNTRFVGLGSAPAWVMAAMAVWALPFLCIGLSMSVRRAATAGASPWLGLLFAAPLLNFLLIAALSLLPDRTSTSESSGKSAAARVSVSGVLLGLGSGAVLSLGLTVLSVYWLASYGAALFVTTPVMIGACASYFVNRNGLQTRRDTWTVAAGAVAVAGLSVLLFAVEGLVCVLMALPLALVAALIGASAARFIIASRGTSARAPLMLVAFLPALAGLERVPEVPRTIEVASRLEIDAAPSAVWQHVIGFEDLPAEREWLFQTGIAYPVRATIDGRGVGAIRRCEFSTGPFIEPITAWEEPTRLAFDVRSQPPPLEEWSPYRHVHPPHLDGYLRSLRGEFRLHALPSGRTRLEGSTWYQLDIAPEPYFAAWSSWAIHRIHLRVLQHVKQLAERSSPAPRGVSTPS